VIAITCRAPATLDRGSLSSDLMEVFGQYGTQSLADFDVGGALTSVTRLIHEYKLVMPSRLSMLIKCLIVLEGTGKALSPKFSLAGLLEPYRAQFVLHQFSPSVLLKKAKRLHRELDVLVEAVPRGLNNLLEQLQGGKFSVRLMDPPLENAVNRLVYGVYISVLLLASSMLWSHDAKPTINGVSVIGCLGYIAAIVLGAKLMWSIRRLNGAKRDKEE
jgi:ubiquinone biosynthesis protein